MIKLKNILGEGLNEAKVYKKGDLISGKPAGSNKEIQGQVVNMKPLKGAMVYIVKAKDGKQWAIHQSELSMRESKLNKKDVSYQLSIDYTGRTKPKVTKLNNKQLSVFYGYKVNPKDVIKSIKKLNPSIKLKHKAWKDNMSGGGVHSFIIESKLTEAGMDKRFAKEFESSCNAFMNHIKEEIKTAEGSDKSVLQKMLKNLSTVKGYPKLMAKIVGYE
jgi:hypothetical protein